MRHLSQSTATLSTPRFVDRSHLTVERVTRYAKHSRRRRDVAGVCIERCRDGGQREIVETRATVPGKRRRDRLHVLGIVFVIEEILRQMIKIDARLMVVEHRACGPQHVRELPEIAGPWMPRERRQHPG